MGLSRRRFLDLVATAVGAGVVAVVAGCQDTLRTNFGRKAGMLTGAVGPKRVAALTALTDMPTEVSLATADGGDRVFAYVQGDEVVVLSSLCTHKGCTVAWKADQNQFACPCHDGFFDRSGNVTGGPPFGPLLRYPTTMQGGDVYINA